MNLSTYLSIAAAIAVFPILVIAMTILHLRKQRLSTLLATIGVWVMLTGGLLNVFFIFRATLTRAYTSIEAAETANFYFTISAVVSYTGVAVFAAGLLWFAVQQPKQPEPNAT